MARYFFHTEDGSSRLDHEGQDLADDTLAKIEAVRLLGQMLKDEPAGFWDHKELKLIVTDADGMILFALDLSAIEAPAIASRRAV